MRFLLEDLFSSRFRFVGEEIVFFFLVDIVVGVGSFCFWIDFVSFCTKFVFN